MPEDPKALVRKAFEMAMRSGKPDWQRMTIAVLKNRILSTTQGRFKESDYGVRTFSEFLGLIEDTVAVDQSMYPPVASLVGATHSAGPPVDAEVRIRGDLWDAVLDYSSGRKYVWDAVRGVAREAEERDDPTHQLPTLSPDELKAWRAAFADSHKAELDEISSGRLATWATKGLPTRFLPAALRGFWNADLKRQINQRLAKWFEQVRLVPPPDLAQRGGRETTEPRVPVEELRKAAIDCIQRMTAKELLDLRIPLRVVLRPHGPRH